MVPLEKPLVKAGIMRADAKLRRERIIDAACDLMRTTPESAVTLEAVAARAEVGIATLYRNFPTRTDLDVACGLRLLGILGERIETTRSLFDGDPRTHWDNLVWGLLDYGVGPSSTPSPSTTGTTTPNWPRNAKRPSWPFRTSWIGQRRPVSFPRT